MSDLKNKITSKVRKGAKLARAAAKGGKGTKLALAAAVLGTVALAAGCSSTHAPSSDTQSKPSVSSNSCKGMNSCKAHNSCKS